jgi:putative heme-binding domain-containing protein
MHRVGSVILVVLLGFGVGRNEGGAADVLNPEDYNQWKKALGTNAATAPGEVQATPGFRVELVRSAEPNEGSWVAMAFDPAGRVILAREDRGLLRLTLPTGSMDRPVVDTVDTNLWECRGLLFAHGALYANANNAKRLYRLRDTNQDGRFDELKLLQSTPGGVGHGRNQLALGPDGLIYSIHGDDVGLPATGASTNSPLQHYAEDHLVPCAWDKVSFNSSARMPYGHVVRTDRDGERWELVAGGMRNPYGLAFNEAGDLFTYDADMEWDVGLPWYHPTRVLHLVPGGDYGWRRGTGVLPVWSSDTLPSAVDIGVGSPTAVQFGTRSHFPERWRKALFILDWAYGKIFAIHLERRGASYAGRAEEFVVGRPLNVTGIDFGPDGAMYFTTGGRRTQSGLYRVSWAGPKPELPAATNSSVVRDTALDRPGPRYEEILDRLKTSPMAEFVERLKSPDRWTRYAARLALEARPVATWHSLALASTDPGVALNAALALARVGGTAVQEELIRSVLKFPPGQLPAEQQLDALRVLAISISRHGLPSDAVVAECLRSWEAHYPGRDARVNQAVCELLVRLESTNVVARTVPLIQAASTQNEKMFYLLHLRGVKRGWTIADRRLYFEWLIRAGREFHGANTLPIALQFIGQEAEAALSDEHRTAVADLLLRLSPAKVRATNATAAVPASRSPAVSGSMAAGRKRIKEWTMADLASLLSPARRHTNAVLASRLFQETGCAQCHRFGEQGGVVGPDLTAVGRRFDRRALLESILEPSKVVAEVYRTTTVVTRSGEILEGRVLSESGDGLVLGTNPLDPTDRPRTIQASEIESRRISELSSMPAGLLDTLDADEILALLSWLEDGLR